tara:strand:- start:9998 stop:10807 length:810 start_codon:yes stop_codon:yes gene_type:complete
MKYIKQIYLSLFLISFVACAQQESHISNPIIRLNFDNDKDTEAVKSILGVKNIEIAPGAGVNGSDGIKANYVGYEKGSERMVKNIRLPKAFKEATLNYAVKFDEDFQFPITGKLHGLGPVNKVTGGNPMHPDGWSARITFSHDGLKPYVYHQHLKGQYGEGQPAPEFHFKKGVYYDLAIHVKVNTPATASNGEVDIYANGEKIVSYGSLQLRAVESTETEINNFLFSTFHGGNTPKYAPKDSQGNYTTVVAWFDDFEVYEGLYVKTAKK